MQASPTRERLQCCQHADGGTDTGVSVYRGGLEDLSAGLDGCTTSESTGNSRALADAAWCHQERVSAMSG